MKIVCAAAAEHYSFEKCVDIGRALNDQLVSIGSTLDHCHVPGREGHKPIGEDVCVLGAGVHNEPVGRRMPPPGGY
jgi:dihydroxyacetone kinase